MKMYHALFSAFLLLISTSVFCAERLAPALDQQAKLKTSGIGATTLYSLYESELDENGHWSETVYFSIKINDKAAARDYGRISISYNDFYTNAELIFANVLSKDGVIKKVSKDAIQLRGVGMQQDFYENRSEIVFSLPQIEPGSILEFQYRKSTKIVAIDTISSDYSSPYWFQQLIAKDGWRADPVLEYRYTRKTPTSVVMHHKVRGGLANKPKVSQHLDKTIYQWEWKNVPEFVIETAMRPSHEILPSIESSSSTQWAMVSDWTWQKIEPKLKKTKSITQIVKQLNLKKNATDIEKIHSVYKYMQSNIRYVFAHLGRGGYEPHFPDEVINGKYGDCKDQTVLALSLFKQLDIEAFPLLVETPNSGKSDTALVRLIFDHMMVWIPATPSHDELFMDTTGDNALFPGASGYLQGQSALIVNGSGGKLISMNVPDLVNSGHIDINYKVSESGKIEVDVEIGYRGVYEQNMRSWWKHDNTRDTQIKKLFSSLFEDKGQYTLSSRVLNAEDLFKPFGISGNFQFTESLKKDEPLNLGASVMQLMALFANASGLQVPEGRRNDYVTTISTETSLTAKFDVPKRYRASLIESGENISLPYFTLNQSAVPSADNFVVNISFKQPQLSLSPKKYAEYYRDMIKISDSGTWLINYQEDPKSLKQDKLSNLKSSAGEETFEFQIELARAHIDSGEFEKALPVALKAVELNKSNGEAWYVLGMAQGFSGYVDKSQLAFDQAKKLGFVP